MSTSGPGQRREDETGRVPRGTVFAAAGLAFAIVLWGGYGRDWAWTGINGSTATLWDWLHLWLLPLLLPTLVVPALLLLVRSRVTIVVPPGASGRASR
jgi:hypothetical protein